MQPRVGGIQNGTCIPIMFIQNYSHDLNLSEIKTNSKGGLRQVVKECQSSLTLI